MKPVGPPPAPPPDVPAAPNRPPVRVKGRVRATQILKGTTVQVLAGPFEGKVGVVQELDGKGGARVVLGTMSSWVPVADLTDESAARARRPFRSSHRKPNR